MSSVHQYVLLLGIDVAHRNQICEVWVLLVDNQFCEVYMWLIDNQLSEV